MDNERWALVDELLRNGDPLGALRTIDDPVVLDEIVRGLARSIYEHGSRPVLSGVAQVAPRNGAWPSSRPAPDNGDAKGLCRVYGGRGTATAGKC